MGRSLLDVGKLSGFRDAAFGQSSVVQTRIGWIISNSAAVYRTSYCILSNTPFILLDGHVVCA